MAERKKFFEDINERLHALVVELMKDHPELEGATIALTYSPEIGDVAKSCLVMSDQTNPELLCRMALQTARLQQVVTAGVGQHLQGAYELLQTIQKEMNDRGSTLRGQGGDPSSPEETTTRSAGNRHTGGPDDAS